jgi:lysyl-tRNA synthetase class II
MPKYEFLIDVTNTGQRLSKEHFPEIKAGTVIEYEKGVPERIKELEDLKLVKEVEEQTQEGDDQLPEDYAELKKLADELEIDYPGNISKKDLVKKIQDKKAEKE